jgi:hypothetical protein
MVGSLRSPKWLRGFPLLAMLVVAAAVAPPAGAAVPLPPVREVGDFACPPDVKSPFTDTSGSPHEFAITCMYASGLANGTTATTFGPGLALTRGQMATFLYRALKPLNDNLDTGEQGFTDDEGSVHEPAINALASVGVALGTAPGKFSPNAPVNRGQMATFLVRMLELAVAVPPGPDYFDDDGGSAHHRAINSLAALGIVQGVGPGRYAPAAVVTRGAMASFLMLWIDRIVSAELTPEAVVPQPGDAAGSGWVELLDVGIPGTICFAWEFEADDPTAVELHQGPVGQVGPLVATLWSLANPDPYCVRTSAATTSALFADPSGFYVDVRSASYPGGAIRGQLAPR